MLSNCPNCKSKTLEMIECEKCNKIGCVRCVSKRQGVWMCFECSKGKPDAASENIFSSMFG